MCAEEGAGSSVEFRVASAACVCEGGGLVGIAAEDWDLKLDASFMPQLGSS